MGIDWWHLCNDIVCRDVGPNVLQRWQAPYPAELALVPMVTTALLDLVFVGLQKLIDFH